MTEHSTPPEGSSAGGSDEHGQEPPSRLRRVATTAAGAVVAGAFYMALIDTTSLPELYTGAAIVLLAGIVFEAAREQTFPEATLRPSWLTGAWRALLQIPKDIVLVSIVAVRELFSRGTREGQLRVVEFRHGAAGSSIDTGRRSLAEAFGSLAPNTIVVGVDEERDVLLVHQLRVRGDRQTIDPLGLG